MREKWPKEVDFDSLSRRFWQKVDKRAANECWPWIGSRNIYGRGQIHVGGKLRPATRVSYVLHRQDIDPLIVGSHICHACDNPSCVNPAHLWQGSAGENTADMLRKNRAKPKLTPDDVRVIRKLAGTASGQRECAARFGIDPKHAYAIFKRIYWASTPD